MFYRFTVLVCKVLSYFLLDRMGEDVAPQQRVEDMIRIAEMCIDLLKENEEHHGEV